MTHQELMDELHLGGKVFSITRVKGGEPDGRTLRGCNLRIFNDIAPGESVLVIEGTLSCAGAAMGFGLTDELPPIPGGFAHFLAGGAGAHFPAGEQVKCSEAVALEMIGAQPKDVMRGFDAIRIKPFDDEDAPDLVTAIVNADQLSALTHLFCFRSAEYDRIIVPMSSGCASIFRIPFGEVDSGRNRAVIGNVDVFSRPHFDKHTLFFTVPGTMYRQMLDDAEASMLTAPIWRGVKSRL